MCKRLQRQRVVARRLRGVAGAARALAAHGARLGVDGFVDMRALRAARPHFPGRAMTDRLRVAEFRHRVVVHAFEIVVGRVVFLDVLLAEHEELALAVASLRRLELAFGRAAGMAAGRPRLNDLRRVGRGAPRLDANLIEQRRSQIHDSVPFAAQRHARPLDVPDFPTSIGLRHGRRFEPCGPHALAPIWQDPGARGKPGLTRRPRAGRT